MITSADSITECLAVEQTGPNRFSCVNQTGARQFVSAGQILGQMIVAAKRIDPDKAVRSIHASFARSGAPDKRIELQLDAVHLGRALGTISARAVQGDRYLASAVILTDAGDEDVVRHQVPFPSVDGPEASTLLPGRPGGPERRIVGAVNLDEAQSNGPPEVFVWARYPDAPSEVTSNQAILCFYIHNNLIPAAMRPHDGIGLAMAHETLSTGVITHGMTFHEPFLVSNWHLLANWSTHAGNGRAFGIGEVFTEGGVHVASFSQQSLLRRPLPGTAALRL